jgi:hypothetical protein
MKSTAYLASARVYSLLMLVAVYLGFNLALSYARRVSLLQEARHAFVTEYLLVHDDRASSRQIAGVGTLRGERMEPDYTNETFEVTKAPAWLVTVTRSSGRNWESIIYDTELRQNANEQLSNPLTAAPPGIEPASARKGPTALTASVTTLKRIALELGIKEPDQNEYNLILRDIEQEVVDREVTVPGIEVAFRRDQAPWIIAFLTIGFLLLIRNQLRWVMLDNDFALEEPWIILDATRGLERLVAYGWFVGICLAPWIATGCLLVVVSGGVVADAGIVSKLRTTVVSMSVTTLVLLGGWASLTVAADVLRLRRLRQDRLRKLSIGSASFTSDFE